MDDNECCYSKVTKSMCNIQEYLDMLDFIQDSVCYLGLEKMSKNLRLISENITKECDIIGKAVFQESEDRFRQTQEASSNLIKTALAVGGMNNNEKPS